MKIKTIPQVVSYLKDSVKHYDDLIEHQVECCFKLKHSGDIISRSENMKLLQERVKCIKIILADLGEPVEF